MLEGRTTHERRNLGPQAVASRSPEAVCTFARPARAPGRRLGQYPQARWRQRQHPLRLSAQPCYWLEPGVRLPVKGRVHIQLDRQKYERLSIMHRIISWPGPPWPLPEA